MHKDEFEFIDFLGSFKVCLSLFFIERDLIGNILPEDWSTRLEDVYPIVYACLICYISSVFDLSLLCLRLSSHH